MPLETPAHPPSLGLSPELVAAAFPFHLAVDRRLQIVQWGNSLQRLCPALRVGGALDDFFTAATPGASLTFETLACRPQQPFQLRACQGQFILRGELLWLPEREVLLFLVSPWVTGLDEITALGLSHADFAGHDSRMDLLAIFQAQKHALAEAQKQATAQAAQQSELQNINARLREQEKETRKLALVAARTTNAVVLTDPQGLIIWVNDGFTRLTGYTQEESLGKSPGSMLQGPETDPAARRYMRQCLDRKKNFTIEILNYSKLGLKYWVEVEVQPILDETGQLQYFMAIETDVTERKRA